MPVQKTEVLKTDAQTLADAGFDITDMFDGMSGFPPSMFDISIFEKDSTLYYQTSVDDPNEFHDVSDVMNEGEFMLIMIDIQKEQG